MISLDCRRNHQLVLANDRAWEEEWYKDEGGRDKCIFLGVELLDSAGNLVTTRRVPLKVRKSTSSLSASIVFTKASTVQVTLCYQSGAEVARQDILKLVEAEHAIAHGRSDIRARIDEVRYASHVASV